MANEEKKTRSPIVAEPPAFAKDRVSVGKRISAIVSNRQPVFGSAKGMIRMADDFDAPIDDFREYME
jgi:hypothetical protein